MKGRTPHSCSTSNLNTIWYTK